MFMFLLHDNRDASAFQKHKVKYIIQNAQKSGLTYQLSFFLKKKAANKCNNRVRSVVSVRSAFKYC